MQQAVSNKRKSCGPDLDSNSFGSLQDTLTDVCSAGLNAAFPGISIQSVVQVAGFEKFGDYQYNAALQLVKVLKSQGTFL